MIERLVTMTYPKAHYLKGSTGKVRSKSEHSTQDLQRTQGRQWSAHKMLWLLMVTTTVIYALCLTSLANASQDTVAAGQNAAEVSGVNNFLDAISNGDLSTAVLRRAFGDDFVDDIGKAGAPTTMMGQLFAVFNAGLLAVAIFWTAYHMTASVVQTAEQGTIMGQRFSTSWVPIRFTIGISSLVPMFGGFCGAQLIFMWFAKIGIGIATLMTATIFQTMLQPTVLNMSSSSSAQPMEDLAFQFYKSEVCSLLRSDFVDRHQGNPNESLPGTNFNGERIEMIWIDNATATSVSDQFIVLNSQNNIRKLSGYAYSTLESLSNPNNLMGDLSCGGAYFEIEVNGLSQNQTAQATSTASAAPYIISNELRDAGFAILSEGASELRQRMQDLASENYYLTAPNPQVIHDIRTAAKEVEDSMNERYAPFAPQVNRNAINKVQEIFDDYGWMALGSFYMTIATETAKMNDAFRINVKILDNAGIDATKYSTDMIDRWKRNMELLDAFQKGNAQARSGLGSVWGLITDTVSKYIIEAMQTISKFLIVNNSEKPTGGGGFSYVDPIVSFKNIGDGLLNTVDFFIGGVLAVKAVQWIADGVDKVTSFASGLFGYSDQKQESQDTPSALEKGMSQLAPIITVLIMIMAIMGILLSVYIPMIPFITWFGGILAWFAVVVQSLVASPIGAFMHLDPEGEGMGNKTQHTYLYLFNILMRPALMVFGFLAAALSVTVLGRVLLELFIPSVISAQANSSTGLFSLLGFLAIFCSLAMTLMHSSFNLIHIIPDQVLQWAGGNAPSDLGRDTDDRTKSTFMAAYQRSESGVRDVGYMRKGVGQAMGNVAKGAAAGGAGRMI